MNLESAYNAAFGVPVNSDGTKHVVDPEVAGKIFVFKSWMMHDCENLKLLYVMKYKNPEDCWIFIIWKTLGRNKPDSLAL